MCKNNKIKSVLGQFKHIKKVFFVAAEKPVHVAEEWRSNNCMQRIFWMEAICSVSYYYYYYFFFFTSLGQPHIVSVHCLQKRDGML